MLTHDVQVSFLLAAGLIGQLTSETFTLLMKLQNKMASIVKSMGNIEHEVYPSNHQQLLPIEIYSVGLIFHIVI